MHSSSFHPWQVHHELAHAGQREGTGCHLEVRQDWRVLFRRWTPIENEKPRDFFFPSTHAACLYIVSLQCHRVSGHLLVQQTHLKGSRASSVTTQGEIEDACTSDNQHSVLALLQSWHESRNCAGMDHRLQRDKRPRRRLKCMYGHTFTLELSRRDKTKIANCPPSFCC